VVLSISLSIRYNENEISSDVAFAPGDTRIISYSSTFCDGLSVYGDDQAKLYLLDKKPSLSGPVNNFSADFPYAVGANSFNYYYYYLYPGSKMNLTYCMDNPGTKLTFALIKGKSNWDYWKDDGDVSHTMELIVVTNLCSSPEYFDFTLTSEDTYYFVFDNTGYSSIDMTATLTLNRTEYLPDSVSAYDSCYTDIFSCSLSVPYGSNYVALLEVYDDEASSGDENLYYTWSCSPRVWIYVLIVVLPLIFVVVTMTLVLIICIILVRKRSQKYANLPTVAVTEETPADTTATMATVTTVAGPPPVNPSYNPAPPTYGSTGATTAGMPPPYPTDGAKI
jgi:hypothetical protein